MDATDVQEAVARARDAVSVGRVFGEPYERNGLTIIPAARIWGGGGGGLQEAGGGSPGFGSGFGLMGRPSGAFVIRGDTVRWQPAVDPNIIVAAALFFLLLTARAVRRRRRRARWARSHGGAVMVGPPGGMPVPAPPPPPPPQGAPHEAA